MTARTRLPNRRAAEHFSFVCNGPRYTASMGRFPDGRLAEIFIGLTIPPALIALADEAGSHSDSAAKDAAVVCSIALQFGVPLNAIRHALLRDAMRQATSPLGCALDIIADEGAS
jgi:hypothetical protein